MIQMTPGEAAEIVRKHIEPLRLELRLEDLQFTVDEARIHVTNDHYRVPVRPSHLPKRLTRFYDFLTELEMEIMEQEGTHILIDTGDSLNDTDPDSK